METTQISQLRTEQKQQELAYERAKQLESRWTIVETCLFTGCILWMFALDRTPVSAAGSLGICLASLAVHAFLSWRRTRACWICHRVQEAG